MRVLWSVNTLPPGIMERFKLSSGHSISWVEAMAEKLTANADIVLTIVAPGGRNTHALCTKTIGKTIYYVLPHNDDKTDCWNRVLNDTKPDIIHIYGTESKHNLLLIQNYKDKYPVIISLQGLVSEYEQYYYAGMSFRDILFNLTPGDLALHRSIWAGRKKFQKQAKYETTMLQSVRYAEGRSDWDYVFSHKLNKDLLYYCCPRMIRAPFFRYTWSYESCEKHSILISQASYPIKGTHFALEAVKILKEDYPDIKLYIAGKSNLFPKTLKERLLFGGYTKYIRRLIDKLGLYNEIEFTGYLDADSMAKKLSAVNLCVVPSAIENAPNSLAEAMVVGTPSVASYVGGNPEMLNNGECGLLYRYDEPEMLAYRITQYFENVDLQKEKSDAARKAAQERHDPNSLEERLLSIYSEVIEKERNKDYVS